MKQDKVLQKRAGKSLRKRGFLKSIYVGIKLFTGLYYYKMFKSGTFRFLGRNLKYFYYPYNATWRNERAIEIPIAISFLRQYRGKKVLEIGNVLSYYYSVRHDILDKYEKAKGAINEDIVDFTPKEKYDFIVSISTLEHVGWDEIPKEPRKLLKGIQNLKKHLNEGGKIVATMPWGHNPELDKMVKSNELKFSKVYFLKRVSRDNRWRQVGIEDIEHVKYGKPYFAANALVVGIIEK